MITPGTPAHTKLLEEYDWYLYDETFRLNLYLALPDEIRGKVVLDLGANIGYFSMFCVQLGARGVIAVEAQPTIFRHGIAERNIPGLLQLTSPYNGRILPLNFAVSKTDDEIVHIECNHVGSTVGLTGEPVKTISLTSLVALYPEASVLKIDIEGGEYDVFLHTDKDIIRKFEVIYLELHGNWPEVAGVVRDMNIVHNRLHECGYNLVWNIAVGPGREADAVNQKWIRI